MVSLLWTENWMVGGGRMRSNKVIEWIDEYWKGIIFGIVMVFVISIIGFAFRSIGQKLLMELLWIVG